MKGENCPYQAEEAAGVSCGVHGGRRVECGEVRGKRKEKKERGKI